MLAPFRHRWSSVGDVARLINSGREQSKYARMIVFLALGGVFLDAYDLTTLSYGIDDVGAGIPALAAFNRHCHLVNNGRHDYR
ncbi:transporter [Klebsiella michiganensis]|uniref:Transporter n=1 Tax=Klebsiella michiganensis TaxID=1134687 RepID=A0A7H4N0K6_9ENTR|nr:transporter [Klebsiella michiganensis]